MRFGPQAPHAAEKLKRLFIAMDAPGEDSAVKAMQSASTLLREHNMSFRQLIQTIEAQQLLMPTKIATALQMVDSNNLHEAANSFLGARRMMKSCGLTFDQIIAALDVDRHGHPEIGRLQTELALKTQDLVSQTQRLASQTQKVEMLSREINRLEANARRSQINSMVLPLKMMFVVFFGLCCAYLATHTALFIAELFRAPETMVVFRPAPAPPALAHPSVPIPSPPAASPHAPPTPLDRSAVLKL